MTLLAKARRRIRRWFGRDEGNATIEFVILFPFMMYLFLSSMEIGYFLLREVLLERAVDLNVRSLRLGSMIPATQDELKSRICDDAMVFGNCEAVMSVELVPIPTDTWTFPANQISCVDRDEEINLAPNYNDGDANELMIVRACVVMEPLFSTTPLVMNLPKDSSGGFRIAAISTFVNEP